MLGWGFNDTTALAVAGPDVFVADAGYNSVTELDAKTGAFVRQLDGPFDQPDAMAVAGADLFVANNGTYVGNSVTEVDIATGATVRVISGPAYHFDFPQAVAASGGKLFVVNEGGGYRENGSVTELDTSTGALVRVITGARYGFDAPDALALAGGRLFVADQVATTVTELDASTGRFVRSMPGPGDSTAMGATGDDILVASWYTGTGENGGTLTELDTSTGAQVMDLSASRYRFRSPSAVAVVGQDVFVANQQGASVTEVDAKSGALVRVISGPDLLLSPPAQVTEGTEGNNLRVGPNALVVSGGELVVAGGTAVTALGVSAPPGQVVLHWASTGSADRIAGPRAMAIVGGDLFVGNQGTPDPVDGARPAAPGTYYDGGSLTELDVGTGALVRVLTNYKYYSNDPASMAGDGSDLFLVGGAGSLTELDASSGALVRVFGPGLVDASPDDVPEAVVADGPDLFVVSAFGNVVELDAATGAKVGALLQSGIPVNGPYSIAADGADVLVAGANTIAELDPATGKTLWSSTIDPYYYTTPPTPYPPYWPHSIVVSGPDIFVSNFSDNSVSELSGPTGALVQVLHSPAYGFACPAGMASSGGDLYVANSCYNTVSELDAWTGAFVSLVQGPAYHFDGPAILVASGDDLFVANAGEGDGQWVTELQL